MNYHTAILMLEDSAASGAATRLLHGAAGGVGVAAVQLCRLHGAEVIGTVGVEARGARRPGSRTPSTIAPDFEAEVLRITPRPRRRYRPRPDRRRESAEKLPVLAPLGRVAFGFSALAPGTSRQVLTAVWQLLRMPRFSPVRLMVTTAACSASIRHLWEEMTLLRTYLDKLVSTTATATSARWSARRSLAEAGAAHALSRAAGTSARSS